MEPGSTGKVYKSRLLAMLKRLKSLNHLGERGRLLLGRWGLLNPYPSLKFRKRNNHDETVQEKR
jgi:hypothetical protein